MHGNNVIISFIRPFFRLDAPLNKFLELWHIVIIDKYSTILIVEPMALEIRDVGMKSNQNLISTLGTQIIDVEFARVFRLQEAWHFWHWVSEHGLPTFGGEAHRDAFIGDVCQIKVETVFLVSSLILAYLLSRSSSAGNNQANNSGETENAEEFKKLQETNICIIINSFKRLLL